MCEGGGGKRGGWLARHRTIEKMSAPHRLDIFKHGHRAVCSGVLISSFLDILEVGAGFEGGGEGGLARHSTINKMGLPYRLEI